ncbi:DUF4097 family beta strand repeat protein [candidate division KSB1 bacterium]|nr:DUF4097 family beta strand repeat protein [candidate division KSB1 bacterium]
MKQSKRFLQAISLTPVLLIPLALCFSQELHKEGRYFVAEIDKSFDVKPGGSLVMQDINGDVDVMTWSNNTVQVHEIRKMDVYTQTEAEAVLKDVESAYVQRGNIIEISGPNVSRSYISSRFTIKVPVKFDIKINTRGGDITVANLAGKVDLNTSGGDIKITNIDGIVNAKTSGGDVEVIKTKQQVNVKTSGGDVTIRDVDGPIDAKTSGGNISVTNNKAYVKAYTSGGDVNLTNVGAEVDAHTSGGDIEVMGSQGSISVSTSGGDVRLQNIGGNVSAHTSGGDIEAMNVMMGIEAATSGGDLVLHQIQGFIEGSTSGGDVEAEMTLTDFSKDHHVDLRSSGGDIELTIPAKLPATISAEIYISRSDYRDDFDITSDFDLTKESITEGRDIIIKANSKINGGGDLINLKTSSGNIVIKKK